MYQFFSDFGPGNNTNIDQAERGTFTMYKKSCYYVHFLVQVKWSEAQNHNCQTANVSGT